MKVRTGSKRLIRDLNQALVVDLIRRHGPLSRLELLERTQLGRSTINTILTDLVRDRLVEEAGSAEPTSVGRPPVLLRLNPEARFIVGVKLAPTQITAALTNLHAQVLERVERELDADAGPDIVTMQLREAIIEVTRSRQLTAADVLGVGVVLPGLIDLRTGMALSSRFLHWRNFDLRSQIARALDVPVFVDNDANAFALAQHWYGAGRGADDLIAVTVGVGIGAGVIIGGRLYRGAREGAGELGHVVMDLDGPLCTCGKHGCLEAYAADVAIARTARERLAQARSVGRLGDTPAAAITRELVVRAAREGDGLARRVLADAGVVLGAALANVVNLLNPARIVIGGEAADGAGDLLLDPMRASLREHAFSILADELEVVPATLGSDAWSIGAATLVLEEVFKPPIFADVAGHRPQLSVASLVH